MKTSRLILFLALMGCASDDGELPVEDGGTEVGEIKGDGTDLAFTEIDDGLDPGAEATRRVFTSAEAYEEFFGRAAPSDVDWDKDWVALFHAGAKPTGGYAASFKRVYVSQTGKTLQIVTSLSSPGDDCFTTQAITTPFVVVRFPRPASNPGRVRFYRDDVTRSCSSAQPVLVTEEDAGGTVSARVGQDIRLELPANPTTGYRWKVTSTNRSFGYPFREDFAPSSDAVGAGGTQIFVWRTSGPLPLAGSHRVTLGYQRGDEAPTRTFEFTVEIAEEQ